MRGPNIANVDTSQYRIKLSPDLNIENEDDLSSGRNETSDDIIFERLKWDEIEAQKSDLPCFVDSISQVLSPKNDEIEEERYNSEIVEEVHLKTRSHVHQEILNGHDYILRYVEEPLLEIIPGKIQKIKKTTPDHETRNNNKQKSVIFIKNLKSFKEEATDRDLSRHKVKRKNSEPETKLKKELSTESEDLLWLLDFKLDDILGESAQNSLTCGFDTDESSKVEIACQTETNKLSSCAKFHQETVEKKQTEPVSNTSRLLNDLRCNDNKKPPFTYTELIERALQEKGPLTVSEIYQWISETFPYYKSWDDRWKNSVRHNLSINPYFRKGTKAKQGSGHLWTVNKSDDSGKMNSWKRQRFQEFEEFNKRAKLEQEQQLEHERMMTETELATASIEDKENRQLHRDVLMTASVDSDLICSSSSSSISLEQSAQDILNGVKKSVEVQYIEPITTDNTNENDFLNPISKEVLMGECGLIELTLQTEEVSGEHHENLTPEIITADHIFEDLNFQYGDITSATSTLLSLVN